MDVYHERFTHISLATFLTNSLQFDGISSRLAVIRNVYQTSQTIITTSKRYNFVKNVTTSKTKRSDPNNIQYETKAYLVIKTQSYSYFIPKATSLSFITMN